jgi:hypothetical protein
MRKHFKDRKETKLVLYILRPLYRIRPPPVITKHLTVANLCVTQYHLMLTHYSVHMLGFHGLNYIHHPHLKLTQKHEL